jgi:antirestriction protein ArdC
VTFASRNVDVYQVVTDSIVAAIEAGGLPPWVRPWGTTGTNGAPAGALPYNGATGREYNGINVVILWAAAMHKGYNDPRWLTFKQAKDLGGNVKKGEKSTLITFWSTIERQNEETGKTERIPFVRGYYVFNWEQCEGIGAGAEPAAPAVSFETAAQILRASRARITHGGDVAGYIPSADRIVLPDIGAFLSVPAYYATALHELTHWTGHGSRLDRDLSGRFGSDSYAMEELVAELGAAFLCARAGVDGQLQHAEYIAHWLRVLKADKKAIFTAAARARDAAAWLCTRAGLDEQTEEPIEMAAK